MCMTKDLYLEELHVSNNPIKPNNPVKKKKKTKDLNQGCFTKEAGEWPMST